MAVIANKVKRIIIVYKAGCRPNAYNAEQQFERKLLHNLMFY